MKPPAQQSPEGEELAHYDDAIIGKAFRWSAVAFAVIVAGGAGAFFFLKKKPAQPPPKVTQIVAPVTQTFASIEVPEVKFADVTAQAGITFVHNNGATGEKLLPETMGGGVGFFDFDNDGDQDLLFVNSTYWPDKTPNGKQATSSALYQNDGKGNFKDVTAGSGLDVPFYGMAPALGDFDNDGLVDVFITAVGGNHLFKNLGNGKFKEVTAETGVGGLPDGWSTCATWFDYDNDGKLDLFVGNYIRWSREIDLKVGWKLTGIGRAYGQPKDFEGAFPYLYHNDGNGKFTEVTAAAGLQIKNPATGVPAAKTLGVAPVDVNGDGWLDLVVANDTVQNFLFLNQHDGTFKEIGGRSGIAFDSFGATRGAMGIDTARYRDDNALGVIIGNFANEMTALYVSQNSSGEILFTDEALTEGIGAPSRLPLKFGVFFFDYDLDGRQDILSANGHLEEEISKIQKSQTYKQAAQLFWNCGPTKSGCFVPVSAAKAGNDLFSPIVGRGSAFADIDGDGDLDVVLTQPGGKPILLRNDQGLGNHWLRVKLIGQKANRDAIGATVHVRVQGKDLWRQVMPTRSYLSQSELPV
ncbi:MAG TPA: CRTAC1 family protein, partial [Verrucomicrobiae bacterium]|nr:CRTAC1 family protein [Verrucomicrobiae bacterium]